MSSIITLALTRPPHQNVRMKITEAEFITSCASAGACPDTSIPEFAFIGRSNVGKSSLVNALTGRKALAMTSATPGKTMLVNFFRINRSWHLVDLPGYGYAQRGKRAMEQLQRLIRSYILERQQLTCLFLLVDSRIPPQKKDLDFTTWLGENGIPFAIVFTKADKAKSGERARNIGAFLRTMQEEWEELPPYFTTSSVTGQGREELLAYIDSIIQSLTAPKE